MPEAVNNCSGRPLDFEIVTWEEKFFGPELSAGGGLSAICQMSDQCEQRLCMKHDRVLKAHFTRGGGGGQPALRNTCVSGCCGVFGICIDAPVQHIVNIFPVIKSVCELCVVRTNKSLYSNNKSYTHTHTISLVLYLYLFPLNVVGLPRISN